MVIKFLPIDKTIKDVWTRIWLFIIFDIPVNQEYLIQEHQRCMDPHFAHAQHFVKSTQLFGNDKS